jgi:hypothetical protein
MSAAEHVFSLPELVHTIIEYLEFDRSALYVAHLVNTTWAEYANKVLWRNAPLSSLSAIEPSRQQHYANLIKNSFSWNGWYPAELDILIFPSLERCLLDVATIFDFTGYRQRLPPYFRSFPQYLDMWLKGAHLPESVDPYWRRGVFEERLFHRHAPRRGQAVRSNSFWINAPKLRSFLSASFSPLNPRPDEAYEHIVSHGLYEELFMWGLCFIPEEIDRLLLKNRQRPLFPKLKHFGARITSGPVDTIFDAFLPSTLSSIYLDVESLASGYFQLVSQYTSLHSVTITGVAGTDNGWMSSIRPLAKLHDLRSLVIERSDDTYPREIGWNMIENTPFTDTDFAVMTSGLPLLEHIGLRLPCKLSLHALTALATNCPLLKTCNLHAAIDITGWGQRNEPTFPNLETLKLTQGEYGDLYGGTSRATHWSSPNKQPIPTVRLIDESAVDPAHLGIILENCPKLSKLHSHLRDYDNTELEQIRLRKSRGGWLDTVLCNAK